MSIEILEPRIAPSGVVQIQTSSKLISLKDSIGADSSLTIVASLTGDITITPDGTTVLNVDGSALSPGQPITLPFFSGSLSAALGGGADNLTLSGHFAGGAKIDLGEGSNEITFDDVAIPGAVSVKGGSGIDSLRFGNLVEFGNSFAMNFGDGESYTSGVAATSLTVAKNFSLQAGSGFNALNISLIDVEIGGNVNFSAKGLANQFTFSAFNRMIVGGSVTMSSVALGAGESFFTLSGNESLTVGGNVVLKTTDAARVGGGIYSQGSTYIGGSVTFNAGTKSSANAPTVQGLESLYIGKSLTISTSENMRPAVIGGSAAGASYIGGPVTIKGSATAMITLDGTIAGKINVAIAGNDGRPLSLTSATADGTLRLLGAVTISTSKEKTGTTLTTLVDNVFALSSLTIKDAAADRNIVVQDSFIIGALTIDTGAGIDNVTIEAHADPGMTVLLGALTIKTGAGLDVITLGGNDAGTGLSTRGKVLVDGGADLANYTIGAATLLQGIPVFKNANLTP